MPESLIQQQNNQVQNVVRDFTEWMGGRHNIIESQDTLQDNTKKGTCLYLFFYQNILTYRDRGEDERVETVQYHQEAEESCLLCVIFLAVTVLQCGCGGVCCLELSCLSPGCAAVCCCCCCSLSSLSNLCYMQYRRSCIPRPPAYICYVHVRTSSEQEQYIRFKERTTASCTAASEVSTGKGRASRGVLRQYVRSVSAGGGEPGPAADRIKIAARD